MRPPCLWPHPHPHLWLRRQVQAQVSTPPRERLRGSAQDARAKDTNAIWARWWYTWVASTGVRGTA